MDRYDIAIIGTGPAGLSAAITGKIRNKNILLIGKRNLSMKVQKAHQISNYLGLPAVSGEAMADAFHRHLEELQIEITEDKINAVYALGDYFSVQGNGTEYEASAVILATGVNVGKPYPGEIEFLGRGVSYCATCDAPLYRGKTAAIIGYSPREEAEAEFMAEIADKVYYLPQYAGEVSLDGNIEVIREKPIAIEGERMAEKLITTGGECKADGFFFLRDSVSPAQLVPGLKMDGNHIAVNRMMETNIPGCFACGDAVGLPYQYIKAAGEGNVAVLSAVGYLSGRQKQS